MQRNFTGTSLFEQSYHGFIDPYCGAMGLIAALGQRPKIRLSFARAMMHGAERSGMYWISKSFRIRKNINRACDLGLTSINVAFISWLVNGGGNGHVNRQQFAAYLRNVLLDEPLLTGTATVNYPNLLLAGNPALCVYFTPVAVPLNLQTTVNYDRQIP